LGIIFDQDGVCSGCRVHEEKYAIDWKDKDRELNEILCNYKNRPGSSYDCIIPVVGTGDDYFVVDRIKNHYKLNPLLVTYNSHFNTAIGVRNLARLIKELDCDHLMSTVGPDTVKRITRITLEKIGDIYWHVLSGSKTFPVQVATKFNIPLIIWGVNGWLDQVGMFSHHDEAEMTKKVRKEHVLRGFDESALIGIDPKLTEKDIQAFTYPSDLQLEKSHVRGLYLGNYVFWDSQKQIEDMIVKYGYETLPQERTFNTYETVHCWNNNSVHDYIKYLKYGYGKATDHASRDIRLKRMSREEGIELVEKYDHQKPKQLELFLKWLGIDEVHLMKWVDLHRDNLIWNDFGSGQWRVRDSVSHHRNDQGVEKNRLKINDPRHYLETPLLESEIEDHYILMGRTYMDELNYKAIEG